LHNPPANEKQGLIPKAMSHQLKEGNLDFYRPVTLLSQHKLTLTLTLAAIKKRTLPGSIKFISTSIFVERECMEWTMCVDLFI
jgi:hypothetical protein